MTNLMHTCFILQYVNYNPVHVSSIKCSSSEANSIDALSGIVLPVSGASVHRLRENCAAVLSQPVQYYNEGSGVHYL